VGDLMKPYDWPGGHTPSDAELEQQEKFRPCDYAPCGAVDSTKCLLLDPEPPLSPATRDRAALLAGCRVARFRKPAERDDVPHPKTVREMREELWAAGWHRAADDATDDEVREMYQQLKEQS
jgi:hypothetical protein